MTQDEIIKMAREVGMEQDGGMWFSNLYKTDMDVHISHLVAFAKLVAAKEREACAKVCAEDTVQAMDFTGGTFVGGYFAQKMIKRGEE